MLHYYAWNPAAGAFTIVYPNSSGAESQNVISLLIDVNSLRNTAWMEWFPYISYPMFYYHMNILKVVISLSNTCRVNDGDEGRGTLSMDKILGFSIMTHNIVLWYHNPKKEDLKVLIQLQKTQEIDGKNIGSETTDVKNFFFHDNIIPCMYYNNHKLLSLSSNYKKNQEAYRPWRSHEYHTDIHVVLRLTCQRESFLHFKLYFGV